MTKGTPQAAAPFSDRTAALVRRTITGVVFVIAGLSFTFGFGNGLALGLRLEVPPWIAGLVSPAVDLSVSALLVAIQYVRAQGVTDALVGARLLLVLCGGMTLAINTLQPLLEHELGRAAFDGVPPCLLLGWSEVGPKLLIVLHRAGRTNADGPGTVPDEVGPSPELVARVRELDAAHRDATGRPITRDKLRAEINVSNAVAGSLLRTVRAEQRGAST
jgi:hypothetical protein